MAEPSSVQADLMRRYLGVRPHTSEDQVLRLTIEAGVRAVGGDEGSLLVFDPETQDLTFVMTYGNAASEASLIGQHVPVGRSLIGLAAETGQVQIGAPRYRDAARTEALEGVRAVLAAPMRVNERLIGVITAISNRDDKRFTMDDAELYACLATIAALVVEQSQRLRALTDGAPADAAAALAGTPLEQQVLARVGRLLQRDTNTVRQLARMLEAMEGFTPV
ncbi:MAG TPA: GAF domain-containing protein [Devosia sp.]|jgi:GAF domain-containing protein|nr:GAF domain-containing protein [Devosia sp.]